VIAALYVETGGIYFDLPGVDPWDESRDARNYAGPHPVVAHPPCNRWAMPLAKVNETRYGHRVGDDGGCFEHALGQVRKWGGVLEHPANTAAWRAFNLAKPSGRGWQKCMDGGWVCHVAQSAYGHKARKYTWLYYSGSPPAQLLWGDGNPTHNVSQMAYGNGVPTLSPKEARATPIAFRDALIDLARLS